MISRPTLIGALVVVELAIVGAAVRSFSGSDSPPEPAIPPAVGVGSGTHWGQLAPGDKRAGSRTSLDRRFATGSAPHVVVDVNDVTVVVQAADAPGVRVVDQMRTYGWVSGTVPPVQAEQTADGVRVSLPSDNGLHVMFGGLEHVVTLTVPRGALVEVTSTDRIEAAGLRARLVAHTGSGSIAIHDHHGDLDVSTDDGRVELVDVRAARVKARSSDGRLNLTSVVADRLEADTDDGRIEAIDVRLADGTITTKSGRVRLTYTPDSDATVTATTADGRLDVPGNLIQNTTSTADGDGSGHSRVVRLGSGRGRFDVTSGDGSIAITQGAHV